jgi:peptidoglycan/LPS O-acetylase OafA/YrhL
MSIDFSEARDLKRFPFLDAARGLASIIVVAAHCNLNWFWGVMDFFFVMSGFLITRSLVSNCQKGRGTLAFLLYRALRLLPAYIVVMLLYEIVVFAIGDRNSFETLPYLFFYQNTDLIMGSEMIFPRAIEMTHWWSLVIEEQFYVLWGAFFCLFAFAKLRINLWSMAIAVLLLGSAILFRKMGVHWWTLPGRFDGFLIGCMAGIIIFMPWKVKLSDRAVNWLLVCGWIAAAAALARLLWSQYLYYYDNERYLTGIWLDISCFAVVSVVVILALVKIDIRKLHFGKVQNGFAFLGLLSYETYLVHLPVIMLMRRVLGYHEYEQRWRIFIATMVISTVIAYFMHRTLTGPALKQRENIYAFLKSRFGGRWSTMGFGNAQPQTVKDSDAT